jgi:dGTPase
MDVADEISYGVHDLEDGIQIGMIERRHVEMPRSVDGQTVRGLVEIFSSEWGRRWGLQNAVDELFSSNPDKKAFRKTAIGGIVHALIGSILIKSDEKFDHPILRYNAVLSEEAKLVVKYINKVAMSEVVGRQAVQTLEYRGRVLVEGIFKAMSNFPDRLLPKDYFEKYDLAKIKKDKMRVICDYVAGMTDSYATRIYERLYIPRTGNVFEKL